MVMNRLWIWERMQFLMVSKLQINGKTVLYERCISQSQAKCLISINNNTVTQNNKDCVPNTEICIKCEFPKC